MLYLICYVFLMYQGCIRIGISEKTEHENWT